MSSNIKVFSLLRLIECFLSAINFAIHIYGVINIQEPVHHDFIYCGAYFGFVLVSIFAIVNHRNNCFNYSEEILSSAFGFILFMATSIWSMVTVEHDIHLIRLTDSEEQAHFFFQFNRMQSVMSLMTGLTFLLHMTFGLDFVLTEASTSNDVNQIHRVGPLELYYFPRAMWTSIKNSFKKLLCRETE